MGKLVRYCHCGLAQQIEDDFKTEESVKIKEELTLVRAQVMMLNNDTEGRWVNGSIGKITGITRNVKGGDIIVAELADGKEVEVTPSTTDAITEMCAGWGWGGLVLLNSNRNSPFNLI